MVRDKRLFARLDLDYADHPKIACLSDSAFRAHVEMILYARKYQTDGIIPKRFASRFATASLSELLANDTESPSLIDRGGGIFELHGYADMNETKSEIERRSRANTENGRRGGLAKARTSKRVAKRVATNSLSEKGSENVAETETETETEVSTTYSLSPAAIEREFNHAYEHWPKKTERKQALARFRIAMRKRPLADLVADIIRFGDAYAATTEKQFVPALGVWLNGERWTDDLPAPRNTTRPSALEQNLATYEHYYGGISERAGGVQALDAGVGQGRQEGHP